MSRSGLTLALVVASAGYGTRLQSGLPKQYVPLLGIPMLQRTLQALSACPAVDALTVVVNYEDVDYCNGEIEHEHIEKVAKVVAGGAERVLSVRNGLLALAELGTWDLVGVHDGARR
jgi:2-C-methyl-D-erythritol 4-phosphate cytidylyltransferase